MSFKLQVRAPLSLGKGANAFLVIKTVPEIICLKKFNMSRICKCVCHLQYITDNVNWSLFKITIGNYDNFIKYCMPYEK